MNLINKEFDNELFNNTFFRQNEIYKADIYKKDDYYNIVLDLPGFKKEDISIDYDNGYISVFASKNEEINDMTFIHKERFYGEYKRTFYVGCCVEDNINASYQDGTLIIRLKKINESNKTSIKID